MVEIMLLANETVTSLAMALVESSKAPLLLLDDDVVVVGASNSFCNTFNLDPANIANRRLAELGAGEWDVPQLNSLLMATIGGAAEIDAYEMDLVREGKATCRLILSAHKLNYFDTETVRVVLAATDVTATRLAEKQKDDLVREKHVLLQELQHRVANSFTPQTRGGRIIVSFAAEKENWMLSVSDNGRGMPVGDEDGKRGLGTGIVEALSKQLDASVTVLDANPGTRVEVRHGPDSKGRG